MKDDLNDHNSYDGKQQLFYGDGGSDLILTCGDSTSTYCWDDAGSRRADGRDGDDYVNGGGLADMLWGGAGDDWIYGYGGDDEMYGWTGDDCMFGGTGNDSIYGEADLDYIDGMSGTEVVCDCGNYAGNKGTDANCDGNDQYCDDTASQCFLK